MIPRDEVERRQDLDDGDDGDTVYCNGNSRTDQCYHDDPECHETFGTTPVTSSSGVPRHVAQDHYWLAPCSRCTIEPQEQTDPDDVYTADDVREAAASGEFDDLFDDGGESA